MKTSEKILTYLADRQASVAELVDYLGISRQAIHRALNKLVSDNKVSKIGTPPKVYYTAVLVADSIQNSSIAHLINNPEAQQVIEADFLYVAPSGQRFSGWSGFTRWCEERSQSVEKMATIYLETKNKYEQHRVDNLIDGMGKLESTFDDVALDEIFYIDFYSYEIFGKTKLGQLLLFAKQSQDISLMNELIDVVKLVIHNVIEKYSIDGVVFIPPTVKREKQFIRQLEKRLRLSTRTLSVVKVQTPIVIPQKTLSKLGDRVVNARDTIVVDDNKGTYHNILLIDDAVGSGATLNETAKKIRAKRICSGKLIGLAITGSAQGFDVISEV